MSSHCLLRVSLTFSGFDNFGYNILEDTNTCQKETSMIKVITRNGYDYIKKDMLQHYIRIGYVLALA